MTTYRASDPKFLAYLVEQYGNCMSFPAVVKEIGASRCTLGRLAAAGELWVYTVGRSRVLRLRTAEVAALSRRHELFRWPRETLVATGPNPIERWFVARANQRLATRWRLTPRGLRDLCDTADWALTTDWWEASSMELTTPYARASRVRSSAYGKAMNPFGDQVFNSPIRRLIICMNWDITHKIRSQNLNIML